MSDIVLTVENLGVEYGGRRRGLGRSDSFFAVRDVSFTIRRGTTLALVGESGSGKTTTALAVANLVTASSGSVVLDGTDLLGLDDEALRLSRSKINFIFQDPYSSLNPRLRAGAIVREPLDSLTSMSTSDKSGRVDELFDSVGLRREHQTLFPHQFSGGQRQRIGIARALATSPDLVICDEPVSALDVAVQAQILNLLRRLQDELGLTYLFISHDLGVVQYMCDDIAVMYRGRIVERGSHRSFFGCPLHPYSISLMSSVPSLERKEIGSDLTGVAAPDIADSSGAVTDSCSFCSRCPRSEDVCGRELPELRPTSSGHLVACHLVDSSDSSI